MGLVLVLPVLVLVLLSPAPVNIGELSRRSDDDNGPLDFFVADFGSHFGD